MTVRNKQQGLSPPPLSLVWNPYWRKSSCLQLRTFLPKGKADIFRSSQGWVRSIRFFDLFRKERRDKKTSFIKIIRNNLKEIKIQFRVISWWTWSAIISSIPSFMCQNRERFGRKVEDTFLYMIIKGSGKAAVILWKSPVLFIFELSFLNPLFRSFIYLPTNR